MPFAKAQPQQARLKMSIYGPPGSGKSFTTLLFAEGLAKVRGQRVAYVDTERGTDFYATKVAERQVHPEAFDFDAVYTRSLADVLREVKAIDQKTHGIVVIDSISHLWEAAMQAYEGKKTSIDSIPMHAWGQIKKPYKELINFLMGSKLDVFILGRQKNVFDQDENGEMKKVGVTMRAEGETPYEPHLCARMESQMHPKDATQTRNCIFFEKDRTGVLANRWFVNPSFKTISGLLPLLGETQAATEDEDERQAKDAELLEKQAEKAKAKEDKSAEIMTELQASIIAANDLGKLAAVGDAVKKAKRNLVDEHQGALRELFKAKRDKLVQETAGDI